MDFRDYTYIKAIAEYGTISKAAEALYISQPSLSKFLAKLETQIGTPLFQRINKQMIPTYAGKLFLKTGEQILILQNQLNTSLTQITRQDEGLLSIVITSTRGYYVLPEVLPEFKKMHPKFHIEIIECSTDEVEPILAKGAANLALYITTERNPDFTYYHIATEEAVLIISPDNPIADHYSLKEKFRYPWLDLSLLCQEVFFLNDISKWIIGRFSHELLREAHIDPDITYMRNNDTCLALACRGMGYAFSFDISTHCFKNYILPPLYRSIGSYPRTVEFVIATRTDYQLSEAEKSFIRLVTRKFHL